MTIFLDYFTAIIKDYVERYITATTPGIFRKNKKHLHTLKDHRVAKCKSNLLFNYNYISVREGDR